MTYRIRNILIAVGLALLAMLLTLFYVTNYKRSVQHSTTGVQIYVAVRDLTAGTAGADIVKQHDLRVETVQQRDVVPGAISSPAQVSGLVLAAPVFAGEQVTLRRFSDVAAQGIRSQLKGTLRAVQVAGDANQLLAGTLATGDHVDSFDQRLREDVYVNEPGEGGRSNPLAVKQHQRPILTEIAEIESVDSNKAGAHEGDVRLGRVR